MGNGVWPALIALILLQQDSQPVQEPFGKVELRVFEEQPASKEMVLMATIETDGGRPEGQDLLVMKACKATISTQDGEKKHKKVTVEAQTGRYQKTAQILSVDGDVTITSPTDAQRFRSPSCTVYFKEKRFETDRPFSLQKPGVLILGGSLKSNIALDEHVLGGTPQIFIIGDPKEATKPNPDVNKIRLEDGFTRIECTGPATVKDGKEQIRIVTEHPVFVTKTDKQGEMKIRASSAVIEARHETDGSAVAQRLSMKGSVRIEDKSSTLTGDSMEWDATTEEAIVPAGKLRMKEVKEEAVREHRVEAGTIRMYKARQLIVAETNVRTSLQQESGVVEISTDRLQIHLERNNGETAARRIYAEGKTNIVRSEARIECRRFHFDVKENRGTLYGGPIAKITRESTRVWAPVVVLKGEEFVISGPKYITFKDGERNASATSAGDITLAGSTLTFQRWAWLSTADFRMIAREVRMELGEDKKLKAMNALGPVVLWAQENGQTVVATAARATQESGSTMMTLFGDPVATLSQNDRRLWANVLTFDQTRHKFTATGSDRPVKIILEERKDAPTNGHGNPR